MMTALAAPHQRKCDRDCRFVRVRLLAAGLSGRQDSAAPMRSAVLTALIIATALFMENMDGTVISTSLPAIARDLHQDPIVLKLALTSYMLTLAVFIPASGWVADRFGARTVFCSAIVVFTLGSILCGASNSLSTLIAARVFQGLGGAMMVPVGRLVLLRSVEKSDLVNALAYLTVPALIGPVAGPPLGGFITTYFHWRWIFWINVPIGVLGVLLSLKFIANLREEVVPRFDFNGFVLSGLGLLGLISGLVADRARHGALLGGGGADRRRALVLLAAYVRHADGNEDAILDLRLLQDSRHSSPESSAGSSSASASAPCRSCCRCCSSSASVSAVRVGLADLRDRRGRASDEIHRLDRSFGRLASAGSLIVNGLISGAFLASYALFTPSTPHWLILLALLVGGFFRSLVFTALNAISYADIDPPRMSRATSFASVSQQMSGAVGVAVAAVCIQLIQFTLDDQALYARDLSIAFLLVAIISSLSTVIFVRLAADAGAAVSGKMVAADEEGAPAPAE